MVPSAFGALVLAFFGVWASPIWDQLLDSCSWSGVCYWPMTNAEGLLFLEENRRRAGVVTLPSGLQYEVVVAGPLEGDRPNATSNVVCTFRAALADGTQVGSSNRWGGKFIIRADQVCPAWLEALVLMHPGDVWRLYVPRELRTGYRGPFFWVPDSAVVVFDLELIEVLPPSGILGALFFTLKRYPVVAIYFITAAFLAYAHLAEKRRELPVYPEFPLATAAQAKGNFKVYLDVKVGEADPCRVEILLFAKHYPRTCENFSALCTGDSRSGQTLTYEGTVFHRTIPAYVCQGGDMTRGEGSGGGQPVVGVSLSAEWGSGLVSHSRAGLVSMVNSMRDPNNPQFFITLTTCTHLDQRHVVFGQVVQGMPVVRQMERIGTTDGAPKVPAIIVGCGVVQARSS